MSDMPVGEARDHFSELICEVERTHERVTVTRHGRPVVVVLSLDDLESLEETLDILSQPGALAEIQDSAAGRVVSIEEVRTEFGRRRCVTNPSKSSSPPPRSVASTGCQTRS